CAAPTRSADISEREDMNWKIIWDLFFICTKVSLVTWGGGPASIALMQRETVAAGWLTSEEFGDSVAIGNALPGPIAPKLAAHVGYKMAGIPGAVAGVFGSVLPTTILMLIVVAFFFSIKDKPQVHSMLMAVRPLVVGVLIWTAYDMAFKVLDADKLGWGRALTQGWSQILIVIASVALLTFTKISPAWLVLAAAALGYVVYR
ncbi:MAG: chromate transporter, partial [Anaerolineales bacterium]|nr:chromate transporter [Anaerolineales bacterium]